MGASASASAWVCVVAFSQARKAAAGSDGEARIVRRDDKTRRCEMTLQHRLRRRIDARKNQRAPGRQPDFAVAENLRRLRRAVEHRGGEAPEWRARAKERRAADAHESDRRRRLRGGSQLRRRDAEAGRGGDDVSSTRGDQRRHPARRLGAAGADGEEGAGQRQGSRNDRARCAIAELRRLSRGAADGNSEGLAPLTKRKAHVGRFVGERQGAAVIDQKAEFAGQAMQVPRGGERGLKRAGDRAHVDCAGEAGERAHHDIAHRLGVRVGVEEMQRVQRFDKAAEARPRLCRATEDCRATTDR